MKMQNDFITMQYDRNHLSSSYQLNILPSFQSPIDTIDFIVILLNIAFLCLVTAFFLYKRSRKQKERVIHVERPEKNNIFPFFSPKSQRKGKNRDTGKQVRDHNHTQLICEKCKYITQINERNLITHTDKY